MWLSLNDGAPIDVGSTVRYDWTDTIKHELWLNITGAVCQNEQYMTIINFKCAPTMVSGL